MRRLILGLSLLGRRRSPPPRATPAKRSFGLDDVARMKSVSDPQVSPDGSWVAYTVRTPDLEGGPQHLRHLDDALGRPGVGAADDEQGVGEHSPRWSPDGKYLAFLSSRDDDNDASQVWLLPAHGRRSGEGHRRKKAASRTSTGPPTAGGSSSSSRIRIPTTRPTTRSQPKKKSKKPIVIDRLPVQARRDRLPRKLRNHLSIFDIATRKSEVLTPATTTRSCPPGRPTARPSRSSPSAWTRRPHRQLGPLCDRASAGRGAPRAHDDERSDNQPDWGSRLAWSPDSKSIAYVQGGPRQAHLLRPAQARARSRGRRNAADRPQASTSTSSLRSTPGTARRFSSCSRTTRPSAWRGFRRRAAPSSGFTGRSVIAGFSAAKGRSPSRWAPPAAGRDLRRREGGETRPLSQQNDELARRGAARSRRGDEAQEQGRHADPRLLDQAAELCGRDYLSRRCFAFMAGRSASSRTRSTRSGTFAANGYVVLAPNPRGSSGRGEKFQTAICADWGNVDTQDVLAAVDYAVGARHRRPESARRGRLELRRHAHGLRHRLDTAVQGGDQWRRHRQRPRRLRQRPVHPRVRGRSSACPGRTSRAGSRSPFRSCTPTGSRRQRSLSAARRTSTCRSWFRADVPGSAEPGRPTQLVIYPGPVPRHPQAELRARPSRALPRLVRQVREDGQAGRRRDDRGLDSGPLKTETALTGAEWKRKAVHAGIGLFALTLRWLDWRVAAAVRPRGPARERARPAALRARPLP